MSKAMAVTDASFAQDVLQSDLPVLVDFWADWCGPCRVLGPTIDQIAEQLDGKLKVVKLDVDGNPATAGQFGIRGIPTLIFFAGGEPRGQVRGLGSKDDLMKEIDQALGIRP